MEMFALALLYGIPVFSAAFAIMMAARGATEAMARQPEIKGNAFTTFILGAAFTEALALIGFVLVLILQGKIG